MSNKVVILTDSTCDLSEELLTKYDIKFFPLHVNFGTDSYDDITQIKPKEMFEKINSTGSLPTTAAASLGEIINVFKIFINIYIINTI